MAFKNLIERQNKLKAALKNPIIEFKKRERTQKIHKNRIYPIVFIIYDKEGSLLYCGRAMRNLSEGFNRFAQIHESDTLEIFPFSRDDAAESFYRQVCYHFNPVYNGVRREV